MVSIQKILTMDRKKSSTVNPRITYILDLSRCTLQELSVGISSSDTYFKYLTQTQGFSTNRKLLCSRHFKPCRFILKFKLTVDSWISELTSSKRFSYSSFCRICASTFCVNLLTLTLILTRSSWASWIASSAFLMLRWMRSIVVAEFFKVNCSFLQLASACLRLLFNSFNLSLVLPRILSSVFFRRESRLSFCSRSLEAFLQTSSFSFSSLLISAFSSSIWRSSTCNVCTADLAFSISLRECSCCWQIF